MAETEHENNIHCINCGGEIEDQNERIRGMIENMTADIAANPDLAAKLYLTLKLAAETVR